ncbi:GrpB family protein [Nocardioides coralli]|uniref:GrpB family protein n=1 Tax=Nocardioides coralli TaxID=2872154 RepID=UPI001CA3F962|nr:GrpB family protein [Nocardioides coralli]QZY28897.1 GrpB family protein [Nocardioides coralli]
MPTPEEITRHHGDEPPPGAPTPWLPGHEAWRSPLEVVEPDPGWPAAFDQVAGAIRAALGDRVLALEHVGSTAVADLPAKPVLDVDLVVADPADEAAYVPDLVAAGFHHVLREPWWHEHRLLKLRDPFTHLHVFGPDSPEVVRHRMFRDWLREHAEDRRRYAEAKRVASGATVRAGGTGMDYNRVKEPVVHEILDRMFRAHGLLPE